MPSKPTPSEISAAVKRVVARAKGRQPSSIRHSQRLKEDLGFSTNGKLGLAPLLNSEFIGLGYVPDPRLHPKHMEVTKTVGQIVSMYRFIFEV